jgi:hypothetical protein
MKGVTTQNPEDGFNQGSMKWIFVEGQAGVFRAGRIKTAGLGEERRDIPLIERNQTLHRHAFSRESVFRA